MTEVVVVDHGLCNVDSVRRALELSGAHVTVSEAPRDLARADRIVLPGVGAFADAMARLRATGLDRALTEAVEQDRVPFLGICLGMQVVMATGAEGGGVAGLGWIDGDVVRLEPSAGERVPHVGWNEVRASDHPLFDGIASGTDFYFVHSYHVRCGAEHALASTPYCGGFTSAVHRDSVVGVQFHPEKSQAAGQRFLANFVADRPC